MFFRVSPPLFPLFFPLSPLFSPSFSLFPLSFPMCLYRCLLNFSLLHCMCLPLESRKSRLDNQYAGKLCIYTLLLLIVDYFQMFCLQKIEIIHYRFLLDFPLLACLCCRLESRESKHENLYIGKLNIYTFLLSIVAYFKIYCL